MVFGVKVGLSAKEMLQNVTLWGRGDGVVCKVLALKTCDPQIDPQQWRQAEVCNGEAENRGSFGFADSQPRWIDDIWVQ